MTRALPPTCAMALALALIACRSEDVVAVGERALAGGGSGMGGGGSSNGGGNGGNAGSQACGGSGSVLDLAAGGNATVCRGMLASNVFTHALCTCGDVAVPRQLFSSGFDSDGMDRHRGGAAVGLNGGFARVGNISVNGSLKVASSQPIVTAGSVAVGGDLWLGGSMTVAGVLTVARDAWLLQTVSAVGVAAIGRDLHTAPDAMLRSVGVATVTGSTTSAPLTLTPPCACEPADLLDIAALVSAARSGNDDEAAGIDAMTGETRAAMDGTVTLDCGRLYFPSLKGMTAHFRVSGHVAIFVDGDVEATSQFALDLEPGAELDWFIAGNFMLADGARIGDAMRPAATRIYVGGAQEIQLPGTTQAAFNLYAPAASVSVGGGGDVFGGIFAQRVSTGADLLLHYDRAILRSKDACSAAPGSCQHCAQCGAGLTCVSSACFTCETDVDCCAPFACLSGKCEPLSALEAL